MEERWEEEEEGGGEVAFGTSRGVTWGISFWFFSAALIWIRNFTGHWGHPSLGRLNLNRKVSYDEPDKVLQLKRSAACFINQLS